MPSVIPLGDKIDTGDRNMRSVDTSRIEGQRQPYRPIQDDPKYAEIKKIIEKFPPSKWTGSNDTSKDGFVNPM